MAIAIRNDVANENPYARIIERLLSERRTVIDYPCPEGNCGRSMFVFYEGQQISPPSNITFCFS